MESKSNRFLIGLIFIILGVYFVSDQYFNIKMGDALIFILGGALLLLYHTKHKIWALVSGMIVYSILLFKIFPYMGGNIFMAFIFIIPGIIFMTLYFSKYKNPFLVTGSIFIWLGIFIVLLGIPVFRGKGASIFFICMGIAFLTIYFINRWEMGKWTLILSVLMLAFGVMLYFGSPFRIVFDIIPSIIPIAFIGIGIIIILKSTIAKK